MSSYVIDDITRDNTVVVSITVPLPPDPEAPDSPNTGVYQQELVLDLDASGHGIPASSVSAFENAMAVYVRNMEVSLNPPPAPPPPAPPSVDPGIVALIGQTISVS